MARDGVCVEGQGGGLGTDNVEDHEESEMSES